MKRLFAIVLLGITCLHAQDVPQIENKTKSLRIRLGKYSHDGYSIWVDNLSPHAVTALRIYPSGSDGDAFLQGLEMTAANPGIAPGGSRRMAYFDPTVKLVLAAVLFADRSHEGNLEIAALLAAHQVGRRFRLEQIRAIVPKTLKRSDLPDADKVAQILNELAALPMPPKDEMMARLLNEFPDLPVAESLSLRELASGLETESDIVAQSLKLFDNYAYSRGAPLGQYWKKLDRTLE